MYVTTEQENIPCVAHKSGIGRKLYI